LGRWLRGTASWLAEWGWVFACDLQIARDGLLGVIISPPGNACQYPKGKVAKKSSPPGILLGFTQAFEMSKGEKKPPEGGGAGFSQIRSKAPAQLDALSF
jgi:hypothetical protein